MAPGGPTTVVGLIMGSDSDWPVVQAAYQELRQFGLPVEVIVASAHRTPERVREWATSAAGRGVRVIIAAAGGAAHLPGVVASWTTLPVVGLPIAASLEGLDALLSVAQMPTGVPVATVGINAARNAALLAVEILALSDARLAQLLDEQRRRQKESAGERERLLLDAIRRSGKPPAGQAVPPPGSEPSVKGPVTGPPERGTCRD